MMQPVDCKAHFFTQVLAELLQMLAEYICAPILDLTLILILQESVQAQKYVPENKSHD